MSTYTLLLDGDWILYAAGFVGQRKKLVYVDPSLFDEPYYPATMTEAKKECGDAFSMSNLYERWEVEPEYSFYATAKSMIDTQIHKVADKFDVPAEQVVVRIFVDGDGNYRSRLATIRPYKGTRSAHSKPLMYNHLRSYLIDAWNAEVVYDQEADDAMAIAQTQATGNTIIVGVDKDMLQVPGWHLNPNKGFKFISEKEGMYRLFEQAAMGDAVDNIAGAYKVGAKAAGKVYRDCTMDEHQCWDALVDIYQQTIDKHGNKYGGLTAEEAALENMRLVYLRRHENEKWVAPGHRN